MPPRFFAARIYPRYLRDRFVTEDRLSSCVERGRPFQRKRGREGEASRVNLANPAPNWLTSFAFFYWYAHVCVPGGGRVSRFIASPLVSRSRAGLARERAASVNLERIQRCRPSRGELSRRNLVRSIIILKFIPFFFFASLCFLFLIHVTRRRRETNKIRTFSLSRYYFYRMMHTIRRE